MRKTIVIAGLIAFVISSCSDAQPAKVSETPVVETKAYNEIAKCTWLIGTWQNISTEGEALEKWEFLNDSTLSGRSYFVAGKDTVSSEKLSLEQKGKDLFYVPTVKNQNDGKPVYFKMTSSTETLIVFENPEHDFPQKITYNKINADSMVAEISGTMEGKQQAQQFAMKRIN